MMTLEESKKILPEPRSFLGCVCVRCEQEKQIRKFEYLGNMKYSRICNACVLKEQFAKQTI